MTFDEITGDGRLWAVRYDGKEDNELYYMFNQWNDVVWLRNFFMANQTDLWLNYTMSSINKTHGYNAGTYAYSK
jgi:hypothetical protein